IVQVLKMQDPSLLMALVNDPGDEMVRGANSVKGDVDTLTVRMASPMRTIRYELDPRSRLMKRVEIDVKEAIEKAGVSDVKKALVTIDYANVVKDGEVKEAEFAWSPPEGARDLAA